MNVAIGLVALATAAISVPAASAPRVQADADQRAKIEALASDIRVVGQRLPAGSPQNAYEAQYAALFSQSVYSCEIVRQAIARSTTVPEPAIRALRSLAASLRDCGAGTGSVNGGATANGGLPGFSVGGGTDYIR